MKMLGLDHIRIDGGTQARLAVDYEVVAEYAEHMQDGDEFPPIVVFYDGATHWLADGFHRYFATKDIGKKNIAAEVREGSQDDAILFAYAANGRRGLSLSAADKRNIVDRMLKHPKWSKWSNAEIARHVGVSMMTVGRIKKALEPQAETKRTYSKNGQEVQMETKNIGKKKNTESKQKNAESQTIEEPSSAAPEEGGYDDKVEELVETINELDRENKLLRDKIAIGQWDASDIEKIDIQEVVDQLREHVRVLEIDNKALRDSRDMFQSRNAELMKLVKTLQAKLKKYEK